MLNEFKDLRALLYKTDMSKEILSQLVLLEIKLLEIETRMEYATEIVKELNLIVANNVCEQNERDEMLVILNTTEYDRIHFGTTDIFGLLDVNDETCIKENWGNKFPPMELPNLSKEEYIIWDNKTNSPKEVLDIVYHHTTLVELINDGFKLNDGEEFVCVKALPLRWQILIDAEIEKCK
jgi:hypothetical protein